MVFFFLSFQNEASLQVDQKQLPKTSLRQRSQNIPPTPPQVNIGISQKVV